MKRNPFVAGGNPRRRRGLIKARPVPRLHSSTGPDRPGQRASGPSPHIRNQIGALDYRNANRTLPIRIRPPCASRDAELELQLELQELLRSLHYAQRVVAKLATPCMRCQSSCSPITLSLIPSRAAALPVLTSRPHCPETASSPSPSTPKIVISLHHGDALSAGQSAHPNAALAPTLISTF